MPASKATKAAAERPTLAFKDQAAWRTWLAKNHASSTGIWMKLERVRPGAKSLTAAETIDIAIGYGWIDGQVRSLNETHWLKAFAPRKPRSIWSRINREKAIALIKSGEMQAAGLAEVERAKADGRWDAAYESQSASAPPPDLTAALKKNKAARAFFAKLDSKNRYAITHRLHLAKKPETRVARLEKFIAMLAAGEKIYK